MTWMIKMSEGTPKDKPDEKQTQMLNQVKLMVLQLANQHRVAVSLHNVQEVVKSEPIVKLRQHHPANLGLAKMKGDLIPIIDMGIAIGEDGLSNPEEGFVLLTDFHELNQGFLVASVEGIIQKKLEDIHGMPTKTLQDEDIYYKAVTDVRGQWVEVIDLEKIVDSVYEYPLFESIPGLITPDAKAS